jgi:hypothetical protein
MSGEDILEREDKKINPEITGLTGTLSLKS